jgi:hypothetical protein
MSLCFIIFSVPIQQPTHRPTEKIAQKVHNRYWPLRSANRREDQSSH